MYYVMVRRLCFHVCYGVTMGLRRLRVKAVKVKAVKVKAVKVKVRRVKKG